MEAPRAVRLLPGGLRLEPGSGLLRRAGSGPAGAGQTTSVCLVPVVAHAHLGEQRHLERGH